MLLSGTRQIMGGPARHEFLMAQIDREKRPLLRVRGIGSTCDCPYGNSCEKCEEESSIIIRFNGHFDHDMLGESFLFWALIAREEHKRELECEIPPATMLLGKWPISEKLQFVYGEYWLRKGWNKNIGWMAPCALSVGDTYLAIRNDSLIRPKVWGDQLAKVE